MQHLANDECGGAHHKAGTLMWIHWTKRGRDWHPMQKERGHIAPLHLPGGRGQLLQGEELAAAMLDPLEQHLQPT